MDNFTNTQKLKILSILISHADSKQEVSISENLISELKNINDNFNHIESMLYEWDKEGIVSYEIYGDQFVSLYLNDKTYSTIYELISAVELHIASLNSVIEQSNARIDNLFSFSQVKLLNDIQLTEKNINEIENVIQNDELMKPLGKTLAEVKDKFTSISVVVRNYDDVYKNIVNPIKEEGQTGIKATVKWAIISIVLSTALSWFVTNYPSLISSNDKPHTSPIENKSN